MSNEPRWDVEIIKYNPSYLSQIHSLFCRTALLGKAIDPVFPAKGFLAQAFLDYYTEYEPHSVLLAVDPQTKRLLGYLVGCEDTNRYQKVQRKRIIPRMAHLFIEELVFLSGRSLMFLIRGARALMNGEFRLHQEAKLLSAFPAHLHLSVDPTVQARGVGSRLIERYLEKLALNSVPGVHIRAYHKGDQSCASPVGFFSKLGFTEWSRARITLYQPFVTDEVHLITMVKSLRR